MDTKPLSLPELIDICHATCGSGKYKLANSKHAHQIIFPRSKYHSLSNSTPSFTAFQAEIPLIQTSDIVWSIFFGITQLYQPTQRHIYGNFRNSIEINLNHMKVTWKLIISVALERFRKQLGVCPSNMLLSFKH